MRNYRLPFLQQSASSTRAGVTRAGVTRAGVTRAGVTRAGVTRGLVYKYSDCASTTQAYRINSRHVHCA
jgi:hypothetical protein